MKRRERDYEISEIKKRFFNFIDLKYKHWPVQEDKPIEEKDSVKYKMGGLDYIVNFNESVRGFVVSVNVYGNKKLNFDSREFGAHLRGIVEKERYDFIKNLHVAYNDSKLNLELNLRDIPSGHHGRLSNKLFSAIRKLGNEEPKKLFDSK